MDNALKKTASCSYYFRVFNVACVYALISTRRRKIRQMKQILVYALGIWLSKLLLQLCMMRIIISSCPY